MRSHWRSGRTRWNPSPRGLAACLVGGIALSVALAATAQAQVGVRPCTDPWPLRRALTMYTGFALPKPLLDQIADHFEFVLEGYRPDLTYMFNRHSKLKYMLSYTSLTDNYVTAGSGKHEWLMANASQFGISGEDAYVHFWEDTVVELQGQRVDHSGLEPQPPGRRPARHRHQSRPGAGAAVLPEPQPSVHQLHDPGGARPQPGLHHEHAQPAAVGRLVPGRRHAGQRSQHHAERLDHQRRQGGRAPAARQVQLGRVHGLVLDGWSSGCSCRI